MTQTTQGENPASRLLLVDDEPAILKLVKHILSKAHYEVVTCTNGVDAQKELENTQFDCIITDSMMPVIDGVNLVKMIRKVPAYGATPILMLTRKRNREDIKIAVEAGVTDYVLKPVDEALLLDKIGLCLNKGPIKREIYEYPLTGELTRGSLLIQCRVISISESEITMRMPFFPPAHRQFKLDAPIFSQIGISAPWIKQIDCRELPPSSPEATELPFEAKFSLIGVPESELSKIRVWIHREEIRRRK